ncbi:MAG: putative peptidoglycan glycosyltransferase FtsW [Corynebacterium sp.]|nr:putative peptidoglycan glycosyltransferase FtsW [Corynebacterium sp.]
MAKLYGWIAGSWTDTKGRPQLDYLMVLGSVLILTALGLVMVLSSSMTWSVFEGQNAWSESLKQTVMVSLGLFAMWVALRTKPRVLRKYSPWIMVLAYILLVAVLIPGIGTGGAEVGSQSWIVVGPVRFQPSEYAKIATAIWGAHYLSIPRQGATTIWRHPYTIFIAICGGIVALIFLQGDLGMTASYGMVVLAILFFAGFSLRLLGGVVAVGLIGFFVVAIGPGYRSARLTVFYDALRGHFEDTRGAAFQSYQGFLSLADGSYGGVGLGQSRAKWFYLPEAKNDFIFAIIGEEMGLWGSALVIILFTLLAIFGIRCATRSLNRYMRLLASTLTSVVVIQAFINISYVIGLAPVTGIQLPLISAGGTAAVINLAAMGVLLSCCRYEPEAISAMQNYGRSVFDRVLRIPEPDVSDIDERHAKKKPETRDRFGVPVTKRGGSTGRSAASRSSAAGRSGSAGRSGGSGRSGSSTGSGTRGSRNSGAGTYTRRESGRGDSSRARDTGSSGYDAEPLNFARRYNRNTPGRDDHGTGPRFGSFDDRRDRR